MLVLPSAPPQTKSCMLSSVDAQKFMGEGGHWKFALALDSNAAWVRVPQGATNGAGCRQVEVMGDAWG